VALLGRPHVTHAYRCLIMRHIVRWFPRRRPRLRLCCQGCARGAFCGRERSVCHDQVGRTRTSLPILAVLAVHLLCQNCALVMVHKKGLYHPVKHPLLLSIPLVSRTHVVHHCTVPEGRTLSSTERQYFRAESLPDMASWPTISGFHNSKYCGRCLAAAGPKLCKQLNSYIADKGKGRYAEHDFQPTDLAILPHYVITKTAKCIGELPCSLLCCWCSSAACVALLIWLCCLQCPTAPPIMRCLIHPVQ
jgi:hypothetical protein